MISTFFRWLGTPIRAVRSLFPFTHDGRQTLIYLMCAFSAPVLTVTVIHILDVLAAATQWAAYRAISLYVAYSLLISVCAFSMFVAFRSLSLGGKDGLLNLTSKENDDPPPSPVEAAKAVQQEVKQAAEGAVERVAAASGEPVTDPAPDAALPDYARG